MNRIIFLLLTSLSFDLFAQEVTNEEAKETITARTKDENKAPEQQVTSTDSGENNSGNQITPIQTVQNEGTQETITTESKNENKAPEQQVTTTDSGENNSDNQITDLSDIVNADSVTTNETSAKTTETKSGGDSNKADAKNSESVGEQRTNLIQSEPEKSEIKEEQPAQQTQEKSDVTKTDSNAEHTSQVPQSEGTSGDQQKNQKEENLFSNAAIDGQSDLFKINFENYIKRAKEISKKQMTDEEISELTQKAMSLIEDMRNRALNEKLKAEDIILKYLNGKEFPDPEEHQGNSDTDQKLVKFTIACHAMHKLINKDLVQKIIAKSPLEMVPIIKELSVFYQFISADPKSFGHGQFTEKQEKNVIIFATNDAIMRIMKGIVYKNLLIHKKIHKMSRLGTNLATNENLTSDDIEKFIAGLKRSPVDDSRLAIYIPGIDIDFSEDDDLESDDFKITSSNYTNELNLYKRLKQEEHLEKAKELAKNLLGIIPNVKVSTSSKVLEFCKVLEQKRNDLEEIAKSDNKKTALKAKRDMSNYVQIERFLICTSKLLDSFYSDPTIFDLIMQKVPEFVPVIGREITIFLKSLGFILGSGDNFDKVVELLRDFAKSSSDGTYLLSPLISEAMKEFENLDIKKILEKSDFPNYDECAYLMIK